MAENGKTFGQREEDDHFFYDGVLAGLGHQDFRDDHLKWLREHIEEVRDAADRGVLTAKSVLEVMKHFK